MPAALAGILLGAILRIKAAYPLAAPGITGNKHPFSALIMKETPSPITQPVHPLLLFPTLTWRFPAMSISNVHFGARIVKFVQKNGRQESQPDFHTKQAVRDRMDQEGHYLYAHNYPDWLVLSKTETTKYNSLDISDSNRYRDALMAKAEQQGIIKIEFDGQGQLKEDSYARAMQSVEASTQQVNGF